MSAKTRITIAVLLLFIPVVLGIVHRIYYHGKDSFVFTWKHKIKKQNNNYIEDPETPRKETPVQEVEPIQNIQKDVKNAPPHFPGGDEALQRYIKNEVLYPENQTIQGKVIIKMRLDEKGYPFDISVTKSLGQDFDKEAVRVVENMPAWEPQIKNYQIVQSDFVFVEVPFQKPVKTKTR